MSNETHSERAAALLCETRGHEGRRPCEFCLMQINACFAPAETHSEKELRGIVEKLREDARTFESPYWTHEPAEPDWDYVAKAFKEIADDIEAATPAPVQGEKGLRERIERIVKNWMWLRAPKAELEQALAATPANKDLAELEAIIIELRQELNVAHAANVREPGPTRLIELKARLEEWERAYHHKSCPAEYPYSEEPCTCYRGKRIAELNALLSSSSAGPATLAEAIIGEQRSLTEAERKGLRKVYEKLALPSSAGEAAPAMPRPPCIYGNQLLSFPGNESKWVHWKPDYGYHVCSATLCAPAATAKGEGT
jgi:hypothetical protein